MTGVQKSRKRSVQTAVPGRRSRTIQRPNHILNRRNPDKSFQSTRPEQNDRGLDTFTQKMVANEDLLAEIIYKIALVPASRPNLEGLNPADVKLLNESMKDTTGLETSADDQILNIKKTGEVDNTRISYNTNDVMSGETSMEWLSQSMAHKPKKNKSKEIIVRKESEDSFLRM